MLDGFVINPLVGGYPYHYEAVAAKNLRLLRQTRTYRPYWIRLPEEQSGVLAAYSTYEYQVHLKPGSWIYAFAVTLFDSITGLPTLAGDSFSVQLTESYTGLEVFNEFADSAPFQHTLGTGDSVYGFHLLPEPRLIVSPGDLDFEACNLSDSDRTWQIVLFTAEPYEVIDAAV